jgi:D-serine deaminase-like pyridoxal phosphate-dependent protein
VDQLTGEPTIDLAACVGARVTDDHVPTPLVYVDRAVLARNIEAMAAAATASGVALRPHTKTHKIAEIARMQLTAGAAGLTVAKLGEAEAFMDAGVETSFMVAQPYVGAANARRQLALARRCEVIACFDDAGAAAQAGTEAAASGQELDAVLIVDTGHGRFGVAPDAAPEIALRMAEAAGVRFRGIRSHSGHAYEARDDAERHRISVADAEAMSEVAGRIRAAGAACDIVSIGSTPGMAALPEPLPALGVSEWRPGNYVFFDCMQVALGSATFDDCALRVVATVVSTAVPGRALIDAGKKELTSTLAPGCTGYGHIVGVEGVEIDALSEECGWVADPADRLTVGQRVDVIPNHACELTNLAEAVSFGVDGVIEGFWEPAARGKAW